MIPVSPTARPIRRRAGRLLAASAVLALALGGQAMAQALAPVPRPNPGPPPAAAIAPAPVLTYQEQQQQALQRIHQYFNAVRTMEGRFTQVAPDGSLQEGAFALQRPGKIRFDYSFPDELLIVSNGTTILVENRVAGTQDNYALRSTPLRYLLADTIDLTSETVVRDVILEGDLITVVLTEDDPDTNGWLTLMFDPETYELRQWATTTDGQTVTVALYDTTTNVVLDENQFRVIFWADGQVPPI